MNTNKRLPPFHKTEWSEFRRLCDIEIVKLGPIEYIDAHSNKTTHILIKTANKCSPTFKKLKA